MPRNHPEVKFETFEEDGLHVWPCNKNGGATFAIGYDNAVLSAKEVGRLIVYLTRLREAE